MGLLDRIKSGLGLSPARPAPKAGFFRENKSPFLNSWRPSLREDHEDVRAAWRDSAARVVDSLQNSGFIAGMLESAISSTVGTELSLAARPNYKILGQTENWSNDWSDMVEQAWEAWSHDPLECDGAGRMTFGQMQQLAYLSWLCYGEVLAALPIRPRRNGSLTKVVMMPPVRLSHKSDGKRLVQGVYVDDMGAAESYCIEYKPRDTYIQEFIVPKFDRDGRQQIVHLFGPSMSSTRGISPLAPVLKVVRQIDQFADATLTTALIQTIFAAVIKSDMQGISAFEGLMTETDQGVLDPAKLADAKAEWYDASKIDLFTHGRIAHLFPTDELQLLSAQHPNSQYDAFMQWLCREVARCTGVTYEDATGDYRQATYSSVRMATSSLWNVVLMRRNGIPAPFSQRVYETWLEDEIGSGRIPFPGGLDAFLANKQAACRARWTGPPKPQADDLKTARAQQTLIQMGVTSLETVCVEYGTDWKAEMERRAREVAYAKKLGLPNPHPFPEDPSFKRSEQGSADDKTDDPSYMPEA